MTINPYRIRTDRLKAGDRLLVIPSQSVLGEQYPHAFIRIAPGEFHVYAELAQVAHVLNVQPGAGGLRVSTTLRDFTAAGSTYWLAAKPQKTTTELVPGDVVAVQDGLAGPRRAHDVTLRGVNYREVASISRSGAMRWIINFTDGTWAVERTDAAWNLKIEEVVERFRLNLYPSLVAGVAYVDVVSIETGEVIDKGIPLDRAKEIYADVLDYDREQPV